MPCSPIVASGTFRENPSILKILRPGRVAVLTNRRGGITVVDPEQTTSSSLLWLENTPFGKYSSYQIVSKSETTDTKVEVFRSRDHLVNFEMEISITGQVTDPVSFVRGYGENGGSIIGPCYPSIRDRIRLIAANYYPRQIHELSKELIHLSGRISEEIPQKECVQIVGMSIDVSIDRKGMDILEGLNTQQLIDEHGIEILIAMAHTNPARKNDYIETYNNIKNHRIDEEEAYLQRFERVLDLGKEIFKDDYRRFREFVNQSDMSRALRQALPPPKTEQKRLGSATANLIPKEEPLQLPPPKKEATE